MIGQLLRRPESGSPVARRQALARLAEQGRLARTATSIDPLPPVLTAPPGGRPLSELLDELRDETRERG